MGCVTLLVVADEDDANKLLDSSLPLNLSFKVRDPVKDNSSAVASSSEVVK